MSAFLFRCPLTKRIADGWIDDRLREELAGAANDIYQLIGCSACRGVHWIDLNTRKASTLNNIPSPRRNVPLRS